MEKNALPAPLRELVERLAGLPGLGPKSALRIRITSYNVCYTKLLRSALMSAPGKPVKRATSPTDNFSPVRAFFTMSHKSSSSGIPSRSDGSHEQDIGCTNAGAGSITSFFVRSLSRSAPH